MKNVKTIVTVVIVGLLAISAMTATAGEDNTIKTEDEVVILGGRWNLEASGNVLVPIGIGADYLNTGFGFFGTVTHPVWSKGSSHLKVGLSVGYVEYPVSDGYYDINTSFSSIPIMFGFESSWGSDIRYYIRGMFGAIVNSVEVCDDYGYCVGSDSETDVGFLADTGLQFKVWKDLLLVVSVGMLFYDYMSDTDMWGTINVTAHIGYEI